MVPKPLVEIGGRPILWHIMKLYSHHGLNEFVICCGYKGTVIKDYFMSYLSHQEISRSTSNPIASKCIEMVANPGR